jgi:hypothetical protein
VGESELAGGDRELVGDFHDDTQVEHGSTDGFMMSIGLACSTEEI